VWVFLELTWTRIPWYAHSQKSSKAHRNNDWKRSSSIPGNQLFTRKDRGKNGSKGQRTGMLTRAGLALEALCKLWARYGLSLVRAEGGVRNQRLFVLQMPKSHWTDCCRDHNRVPSALRQLLLQVWEFQALQLGEQIISGAQTEEQTAVPAPSAKFQDCWVCSSSKF
jgi:hypothetical protein